MNLIWDLILQGAEATVPDIGLVTATWAIAIGTIASAFILAAVTIYFGKQQLAEQRKLLQLQKQTAELQEYITMTDKMIQFDEMLNNDTANQERTAVYKHISREETHGNFEVLAERVTGRFDSVGSFIKINVKLETPYLKLHAEKTGKSWIYLQDYLEKERERRNSPEYGQFFEYLGKKSEEFWNGRHPNHPLGIKKLPPKSA